MKRQTPRLLSLTLLFLFIEFFDELNFALGGAALPAIQRDLALDYAQVGLLLGLPHIIGVVIEWALMLLGDTRLRKALVLGGGLAVALALVLTGSSVVFPMLLLAQIIAFPASGAFVSLSQATLMDLHPGRESPMMARWTVMGSLGNLLGPLILAGLLTIGLSWRSGFFLLAVLCLGLTLVAARQPFPLRAAHVAGTSWRDELGGLLGGMREAITNRLMLRWLLLIQVADLLLDVFTSFVPLYFVNEIGLTDSQAGLVLSALVAGGLLSDLAVVPLLERVPGPRLVRISAAVTLLLFPAFLLVSWLPGKILLGVLVKFSTMGWYAIMMGEAYAAAPGRSGTVNAFSSLSGLLGGALPWLVGLAAAKFGLASAMWLLLLAPVSLLLGVVKSDSNAIEG